MHVVARLKWAMFHPEQVEIKGVSFIIELLGREVWQRAEKAPMLQRVNPERVGKRAFRRTFVPRFSAV